jgi:hypothetical protein
MNNQRSLSPPRIPTVITLGIIGSTQNIKEKDMWGTMDAIAEHLETSPQRILVPSEGNSSVYIQSWADSKKIQYTLFECDWVRLGKRAAMMRDAAIQKEADYFLLVKSPKSKSDRLDKLGASLAKKGKTVFLFGEELELLEVEKAPPKEKKSLKRQVPEPSPSSQSGALKRQVPECTPDNGIRPWFQKLPSPTD